ncbi:MAG TPA: c-type cytochrome [Elusimicrobiota bacterium]|nr:c-type cytochrome [Elusimicrobiota bacterium]
MRRKAVLVLLGALLGACAKDMPPEARGRAAFASYDCKRCHRIGAEGGTTGPDLSYVGFRKSARFLELWLENPSAWQPDTVMPNFHLNEPTRKALAAYLSTLKGQAFASGPKPWDAPEYAGDSVRRGEVLYERVGCVTCHGKAGKGGYHNNNVIGAMVPSLLHAADGFTKAELERRIAVGVRSPVKADPAGAEPFLYMPAWSELLSPAEISALADYLISLKPKGGPQDAW